MQAQGTMILAGNFKGRRIPPLPAALSVRPILARMKKSLFDILKNRIQGAVFLDLFAGSGTVGMEAISRGASRVIFVDNHPYCIQRLRETFQKLLDAKSKNPIDCQVEFHCRNVLSGFAWLQQKCDLIFSGAPYINKQKQPLFFVQKLLQLFVERAILKKSGWFIAQHHKKESFQVPDFWLLFRQEHYGDSLLSFFVPHCRDRISSHDVY